MAEENKTEGDVQMEETQKDQQAEAAAQEAAPSEPEQTAPEPEESVDDMMKQVEETTKEATQTAEEKADDAVAALKEDIKEAESKDKEEDESEESDAPKTEVAEAAAPSADTPLIFALRTTANREDQVMDFLTSNISKKGLSVFSVVRPHGMRGYIFMEAVSRLEAEHAAQGIPYARGILPKEIDYSEMEHMVEPVKRELTIKKNDIVEIISGPFKRETAKITRIDEQKEEVVVELVEAAVPIPITLKIDAVKVIRRESDEDDE